MNHGGIGMEQALRVFITVADVENFTRAAERLHMSQPAVSQYIRQLEQQYGTRLFERTNTYVRLTKAGDIVYHYATQISHLYERMNHLIEDMMYQAKGPLSIGASYTFGEYILPRTVATLLQKYPDIEPSINIGNTQLIADLVANHQLDVGIVEGHFNEHDLEVEAFATDGMVLIASPNHRLAKGMGNTDVKQMEKEMWIVREEGSGTREAIESVWEKLGITPKQQMIFSSTQSIKGAVEAGLGISLLSTAAIEKELKSEHISILPLKGLPFKRTFSIITKQPFQTKACQMFIEELMTQ